MEMESQIRNSIVMTRVNIFNKSLDKLLYNIFFICHHQTVTHH
jgi:hypothetical protein